MASQSPPPPPSPEQILANWHNPLNVNDNASNFSQTIRSTFNLGSPSDEDDKDEDGNLYHYQSEAFSMPLRRIQEIIDEGVMKYYYRSAEGANLEIPKSDIDAYTSIFLPSTDTAKTLKSFAANAKKNSPRSKVAEHLISKRIYPNDENNTGDLSSSDAVYKVPKRKAPFPNPYLDVWIWSCHQTGFIGPLADAHYSHPSAARHTHPMLPVLYHHFGCLCPTYEALYLISNLAKQPGKTGVLEVGSGNGYWSFMLQRPEFGLVDPRNFDNSIDSNSTSTIKTSSSSKKPSNQQPPPTITSIDNASSTYRYTWSTPTHTTSALTYLPCNSATTSTQVLLMVYPVTANDFTEKIIRAYEGDTVVIAGTQNANRFTGFKDMEVEEWFEKENLSEREWGQKGKKKKKRGEWKLKVRIALPSFAGKDEGLFVWVRE